MSLLVLNIECMSRKLSLRYGEERVISVTPVARGLFFPVLVAVTTVILIDYGSWHFGFIHSIRPWLFLLITGPAVLVVATRIWRWRSHKVRVTNQRIIIEGGVMHHYRSEVDLRDVLAIRVDQRLHERLTRRGVVWLETRMGTVGLGFLHHPSALCRIIDQERSTFSEERLDFDTVFDFEPPLSQSFEIAPRRHRNSRRADR